MLHTISVSMRNKVLATLLLFVCLNVFSQQNSKYIAYINKYSSLAVEQMNKYRIPASITLSQGLLESGAGTSSLAISSNNHFGIKCGSTWTGPYVTADDDARGEHFRKYKSVRESYEDHSLFLKRNARYASLFKLSITDYKGWARGLKAAGYATNPQYATRLISIIEQYNLMDYDRGKLRGNAFSDTGFSHDIYGNNGVFYIIAKSGDTFESLSKEFGISKRKLRKYNELYKGYVIREGDILYLAKKKKKAEKRFKNYKYQVKEGDSMYSISQMFCVRIKNLYKMNKMTPNDAIKAGDYLKVR